MDPFDFLVFTGDPVRKIDRFAAGKHLLESVINALVIIRKDYVPGIGGIAPQVVGIAAAEKLRHTVRAEQAPRMPYI